MMFVQRRQGERASNKLFSARCSGDDSHWRANAMLFRVMLRGLVCSLCLSASALPQVRPPQPVQWKASLASGAPVKPGTRAAIDLSGEVQQGWHVYALTQPAG